MPTFTPRMPSDVTQRAGRRILKVLPAFVIGVAGLIQVHTFAERARAKRAAEAVTLLARADVSHRHEHVGNLSRRDQEAIKLALGVPR